MRSHRAALQSPPDDVGAVHKLLKEVWAEGEEIGSADRLRFETALIELSGNVFEHAGGADGLTCWLEVTVGVDRLVAEMSDTGTALEGDVSPRAMPDELAESGRGIALLHALVDEVTYTRDGGLNRWHLMRMLQAPSAGEAQR